MHVSASVCGPQERVSLDPLDWSYRCCKPPAVGAGNQILILWKSSHFSSGPSNLSSTLICLFQDKVSYVLGWP